MRHLGYTAPEQLRCRLKGLSVPALVAEGTKLRPTRSPDPVTAATKASLSSLAHRIEAPRRRACRARRADRGAPRCHRARAARALRRRTRHRSRTGDGGRRQPRAAAFGGCLGPPVRRRTRPGRARARPTARSRPTTVAIARPTARCGASSWCASRTTPRPSSTSSAESRRARPSRGHPHLEALRRPRGLSLPASRLNPRAVGLAFPRTVALRS